MGQWPRIEVRRGKLYRFRQNYTSGKVYDYDFLIGDDGNYYVVYIYDKDHNLTKVTQNNLVEVYRYDQV